MLQSQHIEQIRQLLQQGKMVDAELHCKRVLQSEPTSAEAWFLLAQIAVYYKKLSEALTCVENAIRHDGSNVHHQIFRAYVLSLAGNTEMAYQVLKPLMHDPQEMSVSQLFGRVSWQAGYFNDALLAFRAIAAEKPLMESKILPYARALAALGQNDQVMAQLELLAEAKQLQAESALLLLHAKLGQCSVEELAYLITDFTRQFPTHAGIKQFSALYQAWFAHAALNRTDFGADFQFDSVCKILHLRDERTHLAGLPTDVLKCGAAAAEKGGLWLEFGVCFGRSINILASQYQGTINGFDSFQGLPEDWKPGEPKGSYSTGGRLPRVAENVKLHSGWFEHSLPKFLETQPGHVSFVHIDCDLYSSTATVLTLLAKRFVVGTVLVFDDFLGYEGFESHEYKAFFDHVTANGLRFRLLSYAALSREVAFVLI